MKAVLKSNSSTNIMPTQCSNGPNSPDESTIRKSRADEVGPIRKRRRRKRKLTGISRQRRVANEREKRRVDVVNDALQQLKSLLPIVVPNNVSRFDTLRLASRWIAYLTTIILRDDQARGLSALPPTEEVNTDGLSQLPGRIRERLAELEVFEIEDFELIQNEQFSARLHGSASSCQIREIEERSSGETRFYENITCSPETSNNSAKMTRPMGEQLCSESSNGTSEFAASRTNFQSQNDIPHTPLRNDADIERLSPIKDTETMILSKPTLERSPNPFPCTPLKTVSNSLRTRFELSKKWNFCEMNAMRSTFLREACSNANGL